MRGSDEQNGSLFSYVNLEERIPSRHPLRTIRAIVNAALAALDAEFDALYADEGRPSIAPERLIRASLVQILFSVRSERQLMEQMQYNLLFRWFVGLGIDDPVWVPTVFTKNRDRLLNTDVASKFLAAILAHEDVAPLLSDEHFSVDGTLVEAWASFKSFRPKPPPDGASPPAGSPPPSANDRESTTPKTDSQQSESRPKDGSMDTTKTITGEPIGRNVERDWRGKPWSNATHASVTDPDARLFRKGKGKPAQLCYMAHALMENRNGFVVDAAVTHADGHGERDAAIAMINRHLPGSTRRITLGADKGYDDRGFVETLRRICVTPHVATKAKGSAIDARTTRHPGYAVSQQKRKQVEEPFGWGKTIGPMAKTMLRGLQHVGAQCVFAMAGFNLSKLPRLIPA